MAVLAGCDRTLPSDWERKNEALLEPQADHAPLPAFPNRATLLEFEVRGEHDFRNYVDGATLSVEPNGVVRYVFVARSPSGAENVTYEALRCRTGEYRVYGLGRPDGTWGGRASSWRPITESRQAHHRVLFREYFCPNGSPMASAEEGRSALREGGHHWVRGSNDPSPLPTR